jgi:hypothetical protein
VSVALAIVDNGNIRDENALCLKLAAAVLEAYEVLLKWFPEDSFTRLQRAGMSLTARGGTGFTAIMG